MQLRPKTMARFILLTVVVSAFVGVNSQVPAQATSKVIAFGDSVTEDFGGGVAPSRPISLQLAKRSPLWETGQTTEGAHEASGGATSCDFFTDRSSSLMDGNGKLATWDIRASLASTTGKASGTCSLKIPVNMATGNFNVRLFSNNDSIY